ncbi:MAG: DUF4249 domain-containing protein [Dysgonamonadaceae bacterium]|nr:DUF4249 domain-containing protein [Dysgonamonadaceae bacterium]
MNAKGLFGLLILTLLTTACVSEYNPVLPSDDTKVLFVDGSIIADTASTFHITQSFSLNENTVPDESFVNNANLIIIGNNGYKSAPAINKGKGTYQIEVGNLDDDVEYGLQIEYDGDTYQSALSKPLYTPEIDTFYWVQLEPLAGVSFYLSTHDDTDRAKFFLWNYTEDWEIAVYYPTSTFYDPETNEVTYIPSSNLYFYGWKKNEASVLGSTESLHENKIIDQLLYYLEPEGDRFMTLYCVTVTQKTISQGAYEYYQQVKKQNEEMGGLFTPQPSELDGNIKCVTNPSKKALGYVEPLKNISLKRMFVRAEVFPNPLIWSHEQRWQYEQYCEDHAYDNDYLQALGFSYRSLYYHSLKYRPTGAIFEPYLAPGSWAPAICTDCREYGATKNRPDFWPNDHY